MFTGSFSPEEAARNPVLSVGWRTRSLKVMDKAFTHPILSNPLIDPQGKGTCIYSTLEFPAGRRSLVQATSLPLSKSSKAVSGWKPAGQSVLAPHSLHPCITLFLSSLP